MYFYAMQKWRIKPEEKIVVSFDICSSSTIIEDLTLTNNVGRMFDVLDDLRELIVEKSEGMECEPYKFVGDGWILLFPPQTSGKDLIRFLCLLARKFASRFGRYVEPILEVQPQIKGLSFGVDFGTIYGVNILGKLERIGRPLVIACRLQTAIKNGAESPADKVLVSRHCYVKYFSSVQDIDYYNPVRISRTLRNIRGGVNFPCTLLSLPVKRIGD